MDQKHLEILKSGIDHWNQWRKDNPGIIPDLRGVDLAGANLDGANLAGVRLTEADLYKTNLTKANLTGTFHQVPGWDFSFVKGLIGGTLFSAILWGIIILIIFNCV